MVGQVSPRADQPGLNRHELGIYIYIKTKTNIKTKHDYEHPVCCLICLMGGHGQRVGI
jgi:hypothetical protein